MPGTTAACGPQFSADCNHRHERPRARPGQRIGPACSPKFAENRPQPHESGTQNGTQMQDTPRRRARRMAYNHMKSFGKTWSGRWDSNPRPQPWQVFDGRSLGFASVPYVKRNQRVAARDVRQSSPVAVGSQVKAAPKTAPIRPTALARPSNLACDVDSSK